jgi:hypothetical protein
MYSPVASAGAALSAEEMPPFDLMLTFMRGSSACSLANFSSHGAISDLVEPSLTTTSCQLRVL